jgi:hypothetical protein
VKKPLPEQCKTCFTSNPTSSTRELVERQQHAVAITSFDCRMLPVHGSAQNPPANAQKNISRSIQALTKSTDALQEHTSPQHAISANVETINKGAIEKNHSYSPPRKTINEATPKNT